MIILIEVVNYSYCYENKLYYIWLKRYINPNNWDANRQKAKGMSKAANELNVLMNKLKSNYQSIVDELEVKRNSYTLEDIADAIDIKQNEKQQICFHSYLINFITNNPEDLKFGTLKKKKTLQSHLVYKAYFMMSKTGEPISFKLPNKAITILQKYNLTDDNQFIFPVMNMPTDSSNDRLIQKKESRNAYINKTLKEIAATVGITKNVSFHISRHSFAKNFGY